MTHSYSNLDKYEKEKLYRKINETKKEIQSTVSNFDVEDKISPLIIKYGINTLNWKDFVYKTTLSKDTYYRFKKGKTKLDKRTVLCICIGLHISNTDAKTIMELYGVSLDEISEPDITYMSCLQIASKVEKECDFLGCVDDYLKDNGLPTLIKPPRD